ncbi:transmembrane protein 132B isoform X2 [Dunckerocampus dactyliophorus]|uniref:transmembrane protein 132B isoform X2 n=1 Tax=Dunckerocampus dactyliophorus TaxID=161453 RepID=UPI0024053956|nr:transmembrane protein 132B isoform X2 [Dunckerocampus dactyliophorus]XP_054629812.1 transmembrane protein 132B isoform X2 [Dunckerocampus dactyliophorus]
MDPPRGCALRWRTLLLLLWEVFGSHSGATGSSSGVGPDSAQPRFSASLPTYLPVQCQLSGADSAFFLREANQDVMRNGSLASRTEPFFLHQLEAGVAAPHALPTVACGYGNMSAEQTVPVELLQGPPPGLQLMAEHVTLNWKIKGHVVAPKVGSTNPWIQVLFYLVGRRWEESDPPLPGLLPCVRAVVVRDAIEEAPSAGCRLMGPTGICVVRLEIPPAWFTPLQVRRRPVEGALPSVEVYYSVIPVEGAGLECPSIVNEAWKSPAVNTGPLGGLGMGLGGVWSPLVDGGLQDMQKVGSVAMTVGPVSAKGEILTLDDNVEVLVPPSPVRLGKTVAFGVYMKTYSHVEQFTLRVWFQSGISFLAVKPSDLVAWEIKQEMAPGGGSLAVVCQRKSSSTADRLDSPSYEVMQLDFEVDNVISLAPTQTLHWVVDYLSGAPPSAERVSHLYISNADIQGIVPLAQDTEVVNTAILTGRRVVLPVKVVTVETDGQVRGVDDSVTCSSTDVDVLKVSPNCDQVLVNGKEMRGRQRLAVNFTYMHLSAQLRLTVWVPKLPLQIDVSDTELSQVKGWRVPIAANRRPTRDSEDDEDDERRGGKGCTLQYQYALVRVLTHFVAEPSDPGGEMVYMLGADWQADITHLVLDQLKVEDPRIAKLIDGRVLLGRDLGITTIQVLSALSDSILAEKTVTVLDDKVTITDLGVQLVASLSLSMTSSPGNYQAIQLTTTASDLLHAPKQEAAISAWIHYSDGSVTPLDIYDPKDFLLSALSLDENVISVTNQEQHWPVVVAEGEGQGALVRVEMVISETCQKSKRKSVLASGVGNVMVKFGSKNEEEDRGASAPEDGVAADNATDKQRADEGREWKSSSASVDREEGAMRKVSSTTKSTVTHRASGGKASGGGGRRSGGPSQAGDSASVPALVEVPGSADGELTQTSRGLSDLEIGMYALLGVFCLAILVFLINCVSFAFRYRHKQVPVLEAAGNMNHAHDWVWLGNEADLLADHPDQCPGSLPDECTTIIDRNEEGYEENKYLLNGAGGTLVMGSNSRGTLGGGGGGLGGHRGVSHSQTLPRSIPEPHQCLSAIAADNSPRNAGNKRKRVKFTSFATVLPNDNPGGSVGSVPPYSNSSVLLSKGGEDDIKWVCHDMDLGQSEIRTYMERLQDNL